MMEITNRDPCQTLGYVEQPNVIARLLNQSYHAVTTVIFPPYLDIQLPLPFSRIPVLCSQLNSTSKSKYIFCKNVCFIYDIRSVANRNKSERRKTLIKYLRWPEADLDPRRGGGDWTAGGGGCQARIRFHRWTGLQPRDVSTGIQLYPWLHRGAGLQPRDVSTGIQLYP